MTELAESKLSCLSAAIRLAETGMLSRDESRGVITDPLTGRTRVTTEGILLIAKDMEDYVTGKYAPPEKSIPTTSQDRDLASEDAEI